MEKRWTYFFYVFSLFFTSFCIGHVHAVVEIELMPLKASAKTTQNRVQNTQEEDHNPVLPTQSSNDNTKRLHRYTILGILQETATDRLKAVDHMTESVGSDSGDNQLDDENDADSASTDSDHDDDTEEEQAIPQFRDSATKMIYEDSTSQGSQVYTLLYRQTDHPFWWEKKDNKDSCDMASYCEDRDGNYYVVTMAEDSVVFFNTKESYVECKEFFASESYIEELRCTLKTTQSAAFWRNHEGNYTFADLYTNPTHDYVKGVGQDNFNQFIRFNKEEAPTSVTYNVLYEQNGKYLLKLKVDNPDEQWWWCDEHNKSLQKANTYKPKAKNTTWIEGYQQYAMIVITDNKPSLITINTTFSRTITIGAQENTQVYFVLQSTAGSKSLYRYNHEKHYLEELERWVYCQDKDAIEEKADNNDNRPDIDKNIEEQVAGAGNQDNQASNNVLFYHKDRQEVIYLVLGKKDKNGVYKSKCFQGTLYTTDEQDKYSTLILDNNTQQLPQGAKYFQINAQAQTYTLRNQARGDKAPASAPLAIWHADTHYTCLFDPHKQALDILDHQVKTMRTVLLATSSLINDHRLLYLALTAESIAILVADQDNPNAKSIYTGFANKDKDATPLQLRKATLNIKGSNIDKFALKDVIALVWHDDDNTLDLFTHQRKEDTREGFFPSKVDTACLTEEDVFHVKPRKKKNWWVSGNLNWIFEKNSRIVPFAPVLFEWLNMFWVSIALALISTAPKLVQYFV